MTGEARAEFCGEWFDLPDDGAFVIGRDADLSVDDNPYLHRRFLSIERRDGMWWIANLGGQLAATVAERDGRFQAWLAPSAHLPLVFEDMSVRFTAGGTSYEVNLVLPSPTFTANVHAAEGTGATTLGRVLLTADQHKLVIALAEPALRPERSGRAAVPSSAEAAARLGWSLTKFNRKLDNVCQKLKRAGVQGLHGEPGNLASDRRGRLVEYALSVRLVTADDLPLLDDPET